VFSLRDASGHFLTIKLLDSHIRMLQLGY
jgi:hypothetical protein